MGPPTGLAYWPADTSEPVLELTTGDLLRQAAGDAGTQTALIEAAPPGSASLAGAERTDRRWTYRQLLAEAGQCARWLLTRFSPGERITIWAPNIPEWVILQYGAALAGLPDPAWGEIVAAVLVPATSGQLPPVTELRDLCRAHLAPHKTPTRWFQATDLPLTGSGKIQKFRLKDQINRAELKELPPR